MQEDFTGLFGEGDSAPGVDTGDAEFGSMMQQSPPELVAAHVPAATPAELEKRKSGWMSLVQKFQSNPNLQRAMMMAGAQMAQPLQQGQTTTGNIANSAVVGANAYQMGQTADLARAAAGRKEGRDERGLVVQERAAAGVETERGERMLGMPGQRAAVTQQTATSKSAQAASDYRLETDKLLRGDVVENARQAGKKLGLEIENLRDEQEVAGLRRRIEAMKSRIELDIPDEARQKAALALLEEPTLKLEAHRATIKAQGATAKLNTAKAAAEELETKTIGGLPLSDQQKRVMQKGTSGTTSAVEQQRGGWVDTYNKIKAKHPESPEIAGFTTAEEYAAKKLSEAKAVDLATQINRLDAAGVTDPEIIGPLKEMLKAQTSRRAAGSAAPAGRLKFDNQGNMIR